MSSSLAAAAAAAPDMDNVAQLLIPKVTNVVGTARIDLKALGFEEIDFSTLVHKMPNVIYNAKTSTTLRWNVRVLQHNKKVGGIMHRNGKLNVCGASSVLMFKEGVKKFARYLAVALGITSIKVKDLVVTNVVATMKLPHAINVRAFKLKHGARAEIKDDRPVIKYKSIEPRFTAMIFTEGKINLMGCRSVEELPTVSQKVQELAEGCKRD